MNFEEELEKLDSARLRGSQEKGEIIEATKSDRESGIALWFQYGDESKRYKMTYKRANTATTTVFSCRKSKYKAQAKIKVLNPNLITSKKYEYERENKLGKKMLETCK
ncbi:Oidioi.mRNA.OKI2018_I69.chr2.g6818.t1.cds [Oikopleura dioica]|uniref:Oidioi.mRNA.OKI2018_I69.chr2.g6818.t1.cds n=1 Tax=Oikopleura dioica TaxID=34765 RepID=A0ABN7T475_OIKDI|nr:Oidioi.mRNA.OKI2018_I69.chr2.g6818.t1.cds [Oikopleura dioica]